jgi:alpha-1,2-mannosyltransferase
MTNAGERLAVRLRGLGRPWEVALFLWTPVVLFASVVVGDLLLPSLGDWEIFRAAARSVLHGASPYGAPEAAALAHNDRYVYPPITALLVAPLAVLPDEAGRVLVLLLALACVPVALRLLGVSDWRCYGLALLTAPVLDTVSLGALSSLLLVGIAAAWRYRDRRRLAALVAAVTAVAKLFVWPLLVWLAATRRLRTAVAAAALALVLLASGWAAIGFAGLRSYPTLLRVLSRVEAVQSYSLVGLLRLDGAAATALTALLAVAVVAAIVLAARGADGERRALVLAVAGALAATPVLWLHYFVLLFVPLGLTRPRLSALWFAPLAFWVTPIAHSNGSLWRTCFALGVAVAIVAGTLLGRPAASAAAGRRPAPAGRRRALAAPSRAH